MKQGKLTTALKTLALTTTLAGCSADTNLRHDVAAFQYAHSNPDAVGSLDATAPTVDLAQYRHADDNVPTDQQAPIPSRHAFR